MNNNALYRQGGGAVTVLNDSSASWRAGRQVAGSSNWVTSGSSSIPSTWTNTKLSASPGFVSVATRDLSPSAASSLRNVGTSTPVAVPGYPFPSPLAAAAFEPPRHVLPALDAAVPRVNVGRVDIGAYEGR
jgi:hypothetical protein